jgi:hypothetical protein
MLDTSVANASLRFPAPLADRPQRSRNYSPFLFGVKCGVLHGRGNRMEAEYEIAAAMPELQVVVRSLARIDAPLILQYLG